MKKKALALLMTGVMAVGMAACGSNGGGAAASSGGDAAASNDAQATADAGAASAPSGAGVRLLNGKPEIDAQLQDLAKKYNEETGNTLLVETIGGDTSASDELKKMYQADNMPDIFVIEANQADT